MRSSLHPYHPTPDSTGLGLLVSTLLGGGVLPCVRLTLIGVLPCVREEEEVYLANALCHGWWSEDEDWGDTDDVASTDPVDVAWA